jgi:hypothetical protein
LIGFKGFGGSWADITVAQQSENRPQNRALIVRERLTKTVSFLVPKWWLRQIADASKDTVSVCGNKGGVSPPHLSDSPDEDFSLKWLSEMTGLFSLRSQYNSIEISRGEKAQ